MGHGKCRNPPQESGHRPNTMNTLILVVVVIAVILIIAFLKSRQKYTIDKLLKNLAEELIQPESSKMVEEYISISPFTNISERQLTDVEFEKDELNKSVMIEEEADVNPAAIQDIFGKPLSRLFRFPSGTILERHFCSETRVGVDYLSCFFENDRLFGFVFTFIPVDQPAGIQKSAFLRMAKAIIKDQIGNASEERDTVAKASNEVLFGCTQLCLGGVSLLLFRIDAFADSADLN